MNTDTDYDPFGDEADEAQAPPAPEKPKRARPRAKAAAGDDSSKIVVTLKGGKGFEAPWIVVHAETVEDADATLDALGDLSVKVQRVAAEFSGLAPEQPSAPAQRAPRPQNAVPADAPPAPGPDWTFRSGFSAARGKTWRGWMPPRGSDARPVFF